MDRLGGGGTTSALKHYNGRVAPKTDSTDKFHKQIDPLIILIYYSNSPQYWRPSIQMLPMTTTILTVCATGTLLQETVKIAMFSIDRRPHRFDS